MKQFYPYFLFACAALPSIAAAEPIDLASLENKTWNPKEAYQIAAGQWAVKDWETTNNNTFGIATNWLLDGYANRFHFYGASVSYDATDSWLRSPEFKVRKGRTYNIKFSYRTDATSTQNIPLQYWFNAIDPTTSSSNATNLSKVKTGTGNINITSKVTAYTEKTLEYTAETDGSAFLSFRVYSDGLEDELAGRVYIAGFSLTETGGVAMAAPPTAVSATPGADAALTVDLSWTLPTVDANNEPLTGERAIEKVLVYRDNILAKELAADATTWQDNEEAGLTPGEHSYQIAVVVAGEEGEKSAVVESGYVGPYKYAPTEMLASEWTTYHTGTLNFSSAPGQKPSGYTNSYSIWSLDENTVDAWLSSPQLPLESTKNYKIGFQYQKWPELKVQKFSVYLSSKPLEESNIDEIKALTPIYELTDLTHTASGSAWESVNLKDIAGSGKYVIFHVSGTYQKRFSISAFSVEEDLGIPFAPAAPTELKATPKGLSVTLKWTNPTESTTGEAFTTAQTIQNIVVYRDDQEIKRLEGAATEFTDNSENGLEAGSHSYAISAIVDGKESAKSESVTVDIVDPATPIELTNGTWASDYKNNRDEFTQWWNVKNGDGHALSNTWYHHNAGHIALMNQTGAAENAWLIGPAFNFDKRSEYTFTIQAQHSITSSDDSDDTDLTEQPKTVIRFGLVSSHESIEFARVITDDLVLPATLGNKEVKFRLPAVTTYSVDDDAPEKLHIAFQANTTTGVKHNIFIHSVSLKAQDIPSAVEEISGTENGEVLSVEVYNTSGVLLGTASTPALEGFAPGLYIVKVIYSYSSPKTFKILK